MESTLILDSSTLVIAVYGQENDIVSIEKRKVISSLCWLYSCTKDQVTRNIMRAVNNNYKYRLYYQKHNVYGRILMKTYNS